MSGSRRDLRATLSAAGVPAPAAAAAAAPGQVDPVREGAAVATSGPASPAGEPPAAGAAAADALAAERRRQRDRRLTWLGRPGHQRGRRRHGLVPRLLERGLRRVTEAPLIAGNAADLLVDGLSAYPAMLDLIRSAQRSVCFENYIFRDDAVGRRFADALMERARAGIRVRVLYDWLGSMHTSSRQWKRLREAGCEVRCFGGPSARRPGRVFTRDHRKLLAVDGAAGIVGGFCIGVEWEDDGGLGSWRDTAVRVEGPVAIELEVAFARIWRLAGGDMPDPPRPDHAARAEAPGEVAVRVVDGPPAQARTYRLYQLLAALAEHTLYVTGAYPLAPTALRRALVSAARAGVDVRLLVPDRSDLRLLNQAARAHYARLLRSGVRIYLWQGPMLHAKTLVVDGVLALVGSSNLNPFSMLGCYELDLQLQDPGLAGSLQRQFHLDLERARELTVEDWKRRPKADRISERIGAALLWLPYKLYSG